MNLIIFDCDGVLIDSEPIGSRIEAEVLGAWGIDITPAEIVRQFVGSTVRSMLGTLAREHQIQLPGDLEDLIQVRVLEAFETELQAIPGVHALLDRLDQEQRPRCVASSSDSSRLEHSLGLVGLYARFAPHVFSAQSVKHGKPAPDLFLFAAAEMGFAPAHCLVVEDSEHGVRAAVAAGMEVVGFTGGGHRHPGDAALLLRAGATRVVADMDALRGLVGAQPDS